MGTARSGRDRRDLSKHETVYEHPEYDVHVRPPGVQRREKVTRGVLAGGTSLEAVGGLVGLVSSIVGFASMPFRMAGIAILAIGIALFAQGAAVMSRWKDTVRRIEGSRVKPRELAGGISTEAFAGLVGVALGVLGLMGVHPLVMYPVALVVFGGALLLGGASQPDLVYVAPNNSPKFAKASYDVIQTSGGIMVLVGLSAAVLGLLGLIKVAPILSLVLAGTLVISCALMFTGGALTARLLHRFS